MSDTMGADFSDDQVYRYRLWREIDPAGRRCTFVLLNPSTADATKNDPTVRRCINYATSWGFGIVDVVNIFALRSTDPRALFTHPDPVGPENDEAILRAAISSDLLICAWGVHGRFSGRARIVEEMLRPYNPHALAITKRGEPGHPLYLHHGLQPRPMPKPLEPMTTPRYKQLTEGEFR